MILDAARIDGHSISNVYLFWAVEDNLMTLFEPQNSSWQVNQ